MIKALRFLNQTLFCFLPKVVTLRQTSKQISRLMKTKTYKTPLAMADAYSTTTCTSALAFECELSREAKAQFGFILKLSYHSGKNTVPLLVTEKTAHSCG